MKQYKARTGLTFPASRRDRSKHERGEECEWTRVEEGETTDQIPKKSVEWLLEQGLIEEVTWRNTDQTM